jgi:hypothetical protein
MAKRAFTGGRVAATKATVARRTSRPGRRDCAVSAKAV